MSKVELQAKVDTLEGEIKFLKCLYEEVRLPLASSFGCRRDLYISQLESLDPSRVWVQFKGW